MTDNLFTGENASEKIKKGIERAAEAVGGTMGTAGKNAILEVMESPGHMVTNDGQTILEAIKFADPLEEMGRKILLEAVSRANKTSGDGSSTTCVLTAAILREGEKYVTEATHMEIKRSLELCMPIIEESINKQKRDIDVDKVGIVGTISSEDEAVGAMIQEIYQQIGKEGIIHWDISKTFKDHYTIGQGITVDGASIASPYMCDRDNGTGQFSQTARFTNPLIILTKEKLTTAAVFEQLFVSLNNQGKKEVVVFCDDFEIQVIAQFVATHQIQGFRTVIVKMPVLWKDWWYEDLVKATGATLIDPNAGLGLKNLKIEHLGTVEHMTITKDAVFLDGIKDVSLHVKQLIEENTEESLLRASRLNTKTARYFVGASSESALSYRRLKVEDAINASYQALQNGIVAGGGSAYVEITRRLTDTIGGKILKKALLAPAKQIATNAGELDMVINEDYWNGNGFDTKSGSFVNMFNERIVDPANVVLTACRNAISVAATVLTCSTAVIYPRE